MSIPESIKVEESAGITFLQIENAYASCRISLYGAHVLSFTPRSDDRDRLWLSPHAFLNGERPIRGGIPICWPWFSDDHGREKGALPSHGFLRTQVWQIQKAEETNTGTRIILAPAFSRAEGFEYDCTVTYEVIVGEQLFVSLNTHNTGIVPLQFNGALHTYFSVPDISQITLEGISGTYKDKLESWAEKPTPVPYVISGETDRIHNDAPKTVTINHNQSALTSVENHGHDSIVVWNPWQGAASMADMDAFGFKHMVCVETALINGCTLNPDEKHAIKQVVT